MRSLHPLTLLAMSHSPRIWIVKFLCASDFAEPRNGRAWPVGVRVTLAMADQRDAVLARLARFVSLLSPVCRDCSACLRSPRLIFLGLNQGQTRICHRLYLRVGAKACAMSAMHDTSRPAHVFFNIHFLNSNNRRRILFILIETPRVLQSERDSCMRRGMMSSYHALWEKVAGSASDGSSANASSAARRIRVR